MENILNKISSYNIFNYMFPGAIFSLLAEYITNYTFIQSNIIIALFYYYFVGLIVSRVGSIAIEPVLKWAGFVKFSAYRDFVNVSKSDPKLEILSESNNMYRTLCSLFILLGVTKLYEELSAWYAPILTWSPYVISTLLFLLFLFSYRKQTSYITKRIESGKNQDEKSV